MNPGRPPTSTDVARLAGVSQATVSYVLNAKSGQKIKDETRAKVLAAAEELGYVPSASARSLRTGTSNLVLMPIPDIPFGQLYVRFLNDLNQRLRALGYDAVMYGAAGPDRDWAKWRPAAVLADCSLLNNELLRSLEAAGVRTVVSLGQSECDIPTLAVDDRKIGELAADHLVTRGRRSLAYIAPDPALARFSIPRLEGFRSRAEAAGASVTVHPLSFEDAAAASLAAAWQTGPRPDGVFAYNDEYAMLVMRAIQDEGFAVPGDMAIVGADDLPLCTLLRPRLTSVAALGGATGSELAERIHVLIQGGSWVPVETRFRLIARESS